jgi:hypothetical protein
MLHFGNFMGVKRGRLVRWKFVENELRDAIGVRIFIQDGNADTVDKHHALQRK